MEASPGYRSLRFAETKRESYVRFDLSGPYHYQDMLRVIQDMRDRCKAVGVSLALISLARLTGEMPDFDRYNLGVRFAEVWGSGLKAAVVVPAEGRVNRFFETTAVNRQARVQVFFEEPQALLWLLQP